MKIELLYFDGCPSYKLADEYIKEIIAEEGLDVEYELIDVEKDKRGQILKFLGSPTILIDGEDLEEGVSEAESFELKCRIYSIDGKFAGCPPKEYFREAILKHAEMLA